MKEKIGIATLITGYNYGSSLQAFAVKKILSNIGFDSQILKLSGSIIPGRDVRLKKLISVGLKLFVNENGIKNINNYRQSISKKLPLSSTNLFNKFNNEILAPKVISYGKLKRLARSDEYVAFLCGSDQIWSSITSYVDPFYYLQFAPIEKRVAFAPSFGYDYVPEYNRKKITKYIKQINYKSVREKSGVDIIRQLTGENVEVLIDPTLVLSKSEWNESFDLSSIENENYILAYFLDTPSDNTKKIICDISNRYNLKIVNLPYDFEESSWSDNLVSAGPCEFLKLVKNASFVCTDSFHGTAFSINFNIPFYTFGRNYANVSKQSARINSLLDQTKMMNRYEPITSDECYNISFEQANVFLNEQRKKSMDYLTKILLKGEISSDK